MNEGNEGMEQQPEVAILTGEGEEEGERQVEVVYYTLDRERIRTRDDILDVLEFFFGAIALEKGEAEQQTLSSPMGRFLKRLEIPDGEEEETEEETTTDYR